MAERGDQTSLRNNKTVQVFVERDIKETETEAPRGVLAVGAMILFRTLFCL